MPGFHSVLKDLEEHLKSTQVRASMCCESCVFWMSQSQKCYNDRTADKYKGKRFCRHWKLHEKRDVAKGHIDSQLLQQQQSSKEKKWYGPLTRKLEVL